jgi:hypothetical protein
LEREKHCHKADPDHIGSTHNVPHARLTSKGLEAGSRGKQLNSYHALVKFSGAILRLLFLGWSLFAAYLYSFFSCNKGAIEMMHLY